MTASPLVQAYLARLGCPARPPSAAALADLHRAQATLIPYETTWLHLGEPWGIDPWESIERIVHRRRGGYCFHLNGALAVLLEALGYHVTLHRGGVHHHGPAAADIGGHLVLLVHDLPTAANPGGVWYVDTGLGDALHEPLPLAAGRYRQGPMRFRLGPSPDGIGQWRFERLAGDVEGAMAPVSFEEATTSMGAFEAAHTRNATSPQSPFLRMVTAQRRPATGSTVLRGRVLTTRRGDDVGRRAVTGRDDWFGVLAAQLDLSLTSAGSGADADALDRLWHHASSVPLPDGLGAGTPDCVA
ncbi:MAG: arylamine N-acetyltransferase [Acidimicrobiales bacterium]